MGFGRCKGNASAGDQGWSEHEQDPLSHLRRGLLLGRAQLQWLEEAGKYIQSGKLPR